MSKSSIPEVEKMAETKNFQNRNTSHAFTQHSLEVHNPEIREEKGIPGGRKESNCHCR